MPNTPPKFLWSDVWLLTAIYLAGPRGSAVPLEFIIGAGDYINHAIFTVSELNSGLSRLQRAGLIMVHENGVALTPAGDELVTPTSEKSVNALKHMENIRKHLGAEDWKPGLDPNSANDSESATTYVTAASVHEAYEAYCNSLKRKKKKK